MKKILALVLALCMVLALCACGSKPAEAPAAAPAEETGIKVGMITDVGGVNDQSFNQSAWEGLKALSEENSEITVNYLESKTDADYAANIQNFIDEEYDLIICVGYALAEATRDAAVENPEQKFAIIDDASNSDLDNVACLMFAQEQGSYLVGVVAGMMTESNTVGYVQGMVSGNMNLFGIGFCQGVLAANPEAEILQYNANSFTDSAAGAAAATDMFTKGADIIYHAAGGVGAGVISACADNGIYAIGVDTDQSPLAPETVVTSAMKRVDVASQDISLAVLNGTYSGGIKLYDMSNGGIDIAPTKTLLPDDVIAAVEDAKAAILDGSIVVATSEADCPAFILAD